MALHPEIEALLDLIELGRATGRQRPIHQMSVAEARAAFSDTSRAWETSPVVVPSVCNREIPTRDGDAIAARIYAPGPAAGGAPLPVLLYLHGGGYVLGDLESHDGLCRSLARGSGWAVVAVDYRKAPEHRFPTALDDAVDAVAWLADVGLDHGLDTGCFAVAGDSVGGSMATVLASMAAQEALPLKPRLQILAYPVTDAAEKHPSQSRLGEGCLLESATLDWFYGHYQTEEADRTDWRFSPLRGAAVPGSAPALILIGDHDPLLDETKAYAAKLAEAGIDADLHVLPGIVHDFLRMADLLEEAAGWRKAIADRLNSCAGGFRSGINGEGAEA